MRKNIWLAIIFSSMGLKAQESNVLQLPTPPMPQPFLASHEVEDHNFLDSTKDLIALTAGVSAFIAVDLLKKHPENRYPIYKTSLDALSQ